MSFNPIAAFKTLQDHQVRFVVIGGLAGRLWGSPTVTNDVDICYKRSAVNLGRLAAALQEMQAKLRGVDDQVPFLLDATTLERDQNFTFTTTFGSLDILGAPAGVASFAELEVNAIDFDLGEVVIKVCDLDDLIRMKTAAGRQKDRIDLEVLGAVKEERSRVTPTGTDPASPEPRRLRTL